jgi:hypothetical protein
MNSKIKELIKDLELAQAKARPLPWKFSANIPFYIDMTKPGPSLSKHDDDRPSYWHYDDGMYAAMAIHHVPELIEEIKRLMMIEEAAKIICTHPGFDQVEDDFGERLDNLHDTVTGNKKEYV